MKDHKFGKLTVLHVLGRHPQTKEWMFKARCDCGLNISLSEKELVADGRGSCGHCDDNQPKGD